MRHRALIILIALLPAFLVPGGLRFCLCLCACVSEAAIQPPCCAESVVEADADDGRDLASLEARCADCAPFRTTAAEIQQLSKSSVENELCHAPTPTLHGSVLDLVPPRKFARLSQAARAPLPTIPWAQSFPLLI